MPYNSSLVLDITLSTFVLPFLVSSLCAGGLAYAPPLGTGEVNGDFFFRLNNNNRLESGSDPFQSRTQEAESTQ